MELQEKEKEIQTGNEPTGNERVKSSSVVVSKLS